MSGKKRSTQKRQSSWILPVVGGVSILGGLGALLYLTRKAALAQQQEVQAQAQAAAELAQQQEVQVQAQAAAALAQQQEVQAQAQAAAELAQQEPEEKAIPLPDLRCDAQSMFDHDIVDATTGLQFRVIDEGSKGKGVMYVRRTRERPQNSELSGKFRSNPPLYRYGQRRRKGGTSRLPYHTIRAGEKLCYFHGQVLEIGTEKYQEAMQGWKKNYVVELEGSRNDPNTRILAPNVNEPKDVTDVGFLVNTGLAKDTNCWITHHGDQVWWVATKNIHMCTPLVGRYYRGAIRDIQKGVEIA